MQVPTVCIERVYVWCNTTVIADEVFAHRLGLVPLDVDPAFLEFKDRKHSCMYTARTLLILLRSTKRSSDRSKHARVPAQSHLRAQKKRAKRRDGPQRVVHQLGDTFFTARVGPPG